MNVRGRRRGKQVREAHVEAQRPEERVKFDVCGTHAWRGVAGYDDLPDGSGVSGALHIIKLPWGLTLTICHRIGVYLKNYARDGRSTSAASRNCETH